MAVAAKVIGFDVTQSLETGFGAFRMELASSRFRFAKPAGEMPCEQR